MQVLAHIVVVAFGLFLVALTVVVFARPALAERFFLSFASSPRAHYIEQALRLIIGAALVLHSASMWPAGLFFVVGWAAVIGSAALMILPWQWHQRFAVRVLPVLLRHMKAYAIGLFAFAALVLYGEFSVANDVPSQLNRSGDVGSTSAVAACSPHLHPAVDCFAPVQ